MFRFVKKVVDENKISIYDIREIEEKYSVKFPDKLVDFFLEYNGAEIFLSEISANGVIYEIANLIPVKHGKLPIEKVMEWDKIDGIVKEGLIPVASDRGGNIFYADSESDEILLYLSDDVEKPKSVCRNFQEFVEKITVPVNSY